LAADNGLVFGNCGQRLERPKTHFFASTDSSDTNERGNGAGRA